MLGLFLVSHKSQTGFCVFCWKLLTKIFIIMISKFISLGGKPFSYVFSYILGFKWLNKKIISKAWNHEQQWKYHWVASAATQCKAHGRLDFSFKLVYLALIWRIEASIYRACFIGQQWFCVFRSVLYVFLCFSQKLQFFQEEKNKEIFALRQRIKELEENQRASSILDSRPKRRKI